MDHGVRFTAEKIARRLALIRPLILRPALELPEFELEHLDHPGAAPGSGRQQGKVPWHSYWAGQNIHFVLSTTVAVPPGLAHPALHLPLGVAGDIFTHPEALLRIDGEPLGSADRHHHLIDLPARFAGGTPHRLELTGWTGLTGWPPNPSNPARLQISPCAVVDVDRELQELVTLAEVALDVANTTADRQTGAGLLDALDAAFLRLDTWEPASDRFRASICPALGSLRDGLAAAGPPMDATLHAIGHAHMDIAYLWPIAQTRQKNARTASNVLRLMAANPDYRFSHSQPQLYAYTAQDFPEIFDGIRARVAEGRWEPMGGMWVEPDCNIPGGESLVRQIVLGRRYFAETFGPQAEPPVLWLPDTFGFPHTLPQLMAQAGLTTFITNKLNWNQYTRQPSSTFWWLGPDGSRVLAHVLTTPRKVQHLPFPTNYKSDLTAPEVLGTVTNATAAAVTGLPIAFGYGDGGGGPTSGLIARARAYGEMPGAPALCFSTVREAAAALHDQSGDLPTWDDELYLEGHRGTLTSQAWIKRANRQAEALLHSAEAALAMAYPAGAPQDIRAGLTDIWRRLCLNQFHDILTGTSVTEVYRDARRDFDEITGRVTALRDAALGRVFGRGPDTTVFNPAPAAFSGPVVVPRGQGAQAVPEGDLAWVNLPAYGAGHTASTQERVRVRTTAIGVTLENGRLRAEISPEGLLTRLLHKPTDREAFARGEDGNQLWAFEDRPLSWDAWDIDIFHEDRSERLWPAAMDITATGPLRASVRVVTPWRDSEIVQHISLDAGSPRLEVRTEVDWHQRHTLLKLKVPAAVRNRAATFDIQWGQIRRPTHGDTLRDLARFETAAHKWMDLSEAGFGLAVLNDCKYGCAVRGRTLSLSLIKSATSPDPQADQGRHEFTYAIMPHGGDLEAVRLEAYRLNSPAIVRPGTAPGLPAPLVTCTGSAVILETLKPADDGEGFVQRLYESSGRQARARLGFALPIEAMHRCDLMEATTAPVPLRGQTAEMDLAPFEIVSLKVRPATG